MPTKDIVKCQQVSTKFRDIVKSMSSDVVKEKLFVKTLRSRSLTNIETLLQNFVFKGEFCNGYSGYNHALFNYTSRKAWYMMVNPALPVVTISCMRSRGQADLHLKLHGRALLKTIGTDHPWGETLLCQPRGRVFIGYHAYEKIRKGRLKKYKSFRAEEGDLGSDLASSILSQL